MPDADALPERRPLPVRVGWRAPSTGTERRRNGRAARATPATSGSSTSANVELVVKVLDARAVNGHFWVFYGALSNVEYTITVTDTRHGVESGPTQPGRHARVGRRHCGLRGHGRSRRGRGPRRSSPVGRSARLGRGALRHVRGSTTHSLPEAAAGGALRGREARRCASTRTGSRSKWTGRCPTRASGHGTAVPLTGDTGYFWFFNSANVELVVKVLDGRAVNGHFWVFYGALSNVQYTITVTDTQTGAVKTYATERGAGERRGHRRRSEAQEERKHGFRTWDRKRAAHLYRRAGFGGTPEELDLAVSLGREGAISARRLRRDLDRRPRRLPGPLRFRPRGYPGGDSRRAAASSTPAAGGTCGCSTRRARSKRR